MPLFVDAIATLRNRTALVDRPSGWFNYVPATREGSIELTDGTTASYTTIYRENVWVQAAVDVIALSLMRMPLKVYTRDGGEKARVYDGELYRLLERSPLPDWTPSDLRAYIGKCVAIYGNAYVIKIMSDESATPANLLPGPPLGWRIVGDYYIWTHPESGDEYTFKRWQIAHYRFRDVDADGFGRSPLQSLRRTIANDDAARRYATAAFKQGARPGSILRTDQALPTESAEKLAANWNALHRGSDNAWKTAILTHGLDYALLTHDLEKSAVTEHRDFTPVEVGAAYRIPPAMLGFQKEANFASVDAYHTMLYQDSCGPWVVMIEERTQLDIVDPTPAFANQFVEMDMTGVLRGDPTTEARNIATLITTGVITPNEARAIQNRPPIDQPGADQLLFPMNLSGAVGAQAAEDSGQADDIDLANLNGRASLNGVLTYV